jgi:hypothetical protein
MFAFASRFLHMSTCPARICAPLPQSSERSSSEGDLRYAQSSAMVFDVSPSPIMVVWI